MRERNIKIANDYGQCVEINVQHYENGKSYATIDWTAFNQGHYGGFADCSDELTHKGAMHLLDFIKENFNTEQ